MMGEVKAVDVEKVAWVVGHWNQLSQEDMDSVGVAVEGEADDTAARRGRKDVVEISGKGGVAEKRKARTDKIGDANEWEVGEELAQSVRRERSRGDKIETALGKRSKAVQEERHLVGDGTGGRRSKRLKRT